VQFGQSGKANLLRLANSDRNCGVPSLDLINRWIASGEVFPLRCDYRYLSELPMRGKTAICFQGEL